MKQVLLQDYKDLSCHYCGGTGFYVLERIDRGKDSPRNEVNDCKFCGGTGVRMKAK